MYAVVSDWLNDDSVDVWLYPTYKEAIAGMNRLWEQSFNLALEDDDFNEEESYHEEKVAEVFWLDGTIRRFSVVKVNEKEKIL